MKNKQDKTKTKKQQNRYTYIQNTLIKGDEHQNQRNRKETGNKRKKRKG